MGVPQFSNGQLVFGPFTGSPFNGAWTQVRRYRHYSLGAYQAKFALQKTITGTSLQIHLTSAGDAIQFYQPSGGGEQFSPSPGLEEDLDIIEFIMRPGADSGDRLVVEAYDVTDGTPSVILEADGTGTVAQPGDHAGGYIKIGRGDNTNYPFDGIISMTAIFLETLTDDERAACMAHMASTDLLTIPGKAPWFFPLLSVSSSAEIVDNGTAGLAFVGASSSGFTLVTEPGIWNGSHTLPAPENDVAPSILGSTLNGSLLTCMPGTWTGAPTFTYQWLADDVEITGATSSTYTLTTDEVGKLIVCHVTASNVAGDAEADSNELGPIRASIPLPIRYDEMMLVDDVWVRAPAFTLAGGGWVPS